MPTIIAAISLNGVIGSDNQLPDWKIPGDLKRFKELTVGKVVVMGRKTYESIGKPLPNRLNIVISSDISDNIQDVFVARSLEEAYNKAKIEMPSGEVMIIGGGTIYAQALKDCNKMFLTVLKQNWEGDVYFPMTYAELTRNDDWELVESIEHPSHFFNTYTRKVKK